MRASLLQSPSLTCPSWLLHLGAQPAAPRFAGLLKLPSPGATTAPPTHSPCQLPASCSPFFNTAHSAQPPSHPPVHNPPPIPAVLDGMDVVYKVEAVGSGSGKPSKKVVIVKSGELPVDEPIADE